MIAGDGLTRALKEIRESNQEITLFRAETMFKANQYEHFTGSYKIRTAIIPLKGSPTSEDVALAKAYPFSPETNTCNPLRWTKV